MSIFNVKAQLCKLESLDFSKTQAVEILANKEIAAFLLAKNFANNRRPQASRVSAYHQAMSEGRWVLGDPIKFNRLGELVDGQNRLMALLRDTSGELIVPFVLLTGQPEKAAETYDQGMKRNTLHITRIRGIEGIVNNHVSILRMMFYFRFPGTKKMSNVMSPLVIADIFEKHHEIKKAIDFSLKYRGRTFALSYAPVLAVVARAYLSDFPLSNKDLDFFLHIFQGGTESQYDDICQRSASMPSLLRNTILKHKAENMMSGDGARIKFFLRAQSALVAYSQNREKRHLKATEENVFPVPLIDYMNFQSLAFDPSVKNRIA